MSSRPEAVCSYCPQACRVVRTGGALGRCGAPTLPLVAHVQAHHFEEPCISGTRGSGTVFFSPCNLHCLFCQNSDISQRKTGTPYAPRDLADLFLKLQDQGLHNVNLVSPTPYLGPIAEALDDAKKRGLQIPVVWNSHGYETAESLHSLNGLVEIFLPDLKYSEDSLAQNYSSAPRYFHFAQAALLKMRQLQPVDLFSDEGILLKGLLIRHLVLPGQVENSIAVLRWIAKALGPQTRVSLMAQYFPAHQAIGDPTLGRRLTAPEYDRVTDAAWELGLEEAFVQELESGDSKYVPPFSK